MGPSQICGCPFREPRVFTIAHMCVYVYIWMTSQRWRERERERYINTNILNIHRCIHTWINLRYLNSSTDRQVCERLCVWYGTIWHGMVWDGYHLPPQDWVQWHQKTRELFCKATGQQSSIRDDRCTSLIWCLLHVTYVAVMGNGWKWTSSLYSKSLNVLNKGDGFFWWLRWWWHHLMLGTCCRMRRANSPRPSSGSLQPVIHPLFHTRWWTWISSCCGLEWCAGSLSSHACGTSWTCWSLSSDRTFCAKCCKVDGSVKRTCEEMLKAECVR